MGETIQNRDPGSSALTVQSTPDTHATDCHAAAFSLAATSGRASAVSAYSENPQAPVVTGRGPGVLLDLKDANGVSKFSVSQTGALQAGGVTVPTNSTAVLLAGDQVINGEKTFNTNIPVFPAVDPAFDNQGARKAYVDAKDTAWRRRHMPPLIIQKALYTSAQIGGTCTLTLAQTSTPVGGFVKYTPAPVALTGSGNTADQVGPFTYAADEIALSSTSTNFVVSTSIDPHVNTTPTAVLSVSFGTDADVFQVRLLPQQASDCFRLFIDGVPVQAAPVLLSSVATEGGFGNSHLLTVNLGSSQPRRIRIELVTTRFGGVFQAPTFDFWQIGLHGPKIAVLGDSTSGGSAVNTGAAAGTWFNLMCDLFGWENRWNQSRGGTGYITTNAPFTTLPNRVALDIVAKNFDIVLVDAGHNDASTDQAAFQAAVTSTISAIKAGLPKAWVIGVGCYSTSGYWPPYATTPVATPAASAVTKDGWQRQVFQAQGVPYISQITGEIRDASWAVVDTIGPWMTGSGRVGAGNTTGFGSADRFLGDGAADATHPNDLGHKMKAMWMATALRKLMAV
jgi:lysophospholipase L1-like esterase